MWDLDRLRLSASKNKQKYFEFKNTILQFLFCKYTAEESHYFQACFYHNKAKNCCSVSRAHFMDSK